MQSLFPSAPARNERSSNKKKERSGIYEATGLTGIFIRRPFSSDRFLFSRTRQTPDETASQRAQCHTSLRSICYVARSNSDAHFYRPDLDSRLFTYLHLSNAKAADRPLLGGCRRGLNLSLESEAHCSEIVLHLAS